MNLSHHNTMQKICGHLLYTHTKTEHTEAMATYRMITGGETKQM